MTKEEFEKQLDGMAFNGENLGKFLRENYSLSVPTTITEDMTNGIDEGIRCAMCTNPMANNRGCDGMCKVDKTMYRKVLDVINNTLYKGNFTMPTRTKAKWIPVSEKLPEEYICDDGYIEPSDYVLVWGDHGNYGISRYWGNRRSKSESPNTYKDWMDLDWVAQKPIAWMPLPEPYSAEMESEE